MATTTYLTKQSAPSATTATTLYTVGAGAKTVCSALHVCNRSATPATFRVAIRLLGAVLANQHYMYYEVPIGANDAFSVREGWLLNATDVVEVYASTANLTFTLFVQEVA